MRIVVGLLIGCVVLAAALIACWRFGFDAKKVPIVLLGVAVVAGDVLTKVQRSKALRLYWGRTCTGIRWRRSFPNSPKAEIREFLDLFVNAFCFGRKRRCCFLPEDRVMDVYLAIYPPGSVSDSMELEELWRMLRKRYGVDFSTSWRQDLTLGEIYELSQRAVNRRL